MGSEDTHDLFSRQSSFYAKYRPRYPNEIFEFICKHCPEKRSLAWDVGTGNGQAAVELAKHFSRVVGTDISTAQLAHAPKADNILYAATSEQPSHSELDALLGGPSSVDVITCATAYHWMDPTFFKAVVHRMLRPGGLVVVWSYRHDFVNPSFDAVLKEFEDSVFPFRSCHLGNIDDEYRSIPFDFKAVPGLEASGTGPYFFTATRRCTLADYFGFLSSWSPVQTALDKGVNLLNDQVKQKFEAAWGDPELELQVVSPVFMRIGTI